MFRTGLLFFCTLLALPAISQSPDYSSLTSWAAHPLKHDPSDSIPSFIASEPRGQEADVFFLHPTTYIGFAAPINASVNDERVNRSTDDRVLLNQASVFNAAARVYAPRYRQAHIRAFLQLRSASTQAAFDTAYADLRAAFLWYLQHENKGRPIIIAAHSQGSLHAIRLLQEFFDGKPLQQQLVCAYVVGWPVPRDAFHNLPFGRSATETGCVLGWQSFSEGYAGFEMRMQPSPPSFCVNPISWTTGPEAAGSAQHMGALGRRFNEPLLHSVAAHVDSAAGVLRVNAPLTLGRGNLHIADYNLFWLDIRANVRQRVDAFLQKKKAAR
jgi:hypothetical protein